MNSEKRVDAIKKHLSPLRASLLNHPIYRAIDRREKLHVFMQQHIFAVWDFMSLLKTLQHAISPNRLPWLPPSEPAAVRFLNEIVLAEESDEDGHGGFASHFDLYHRAMRRCGASTSRIDRFVSDLRQNDSVEKALDACQTPDCVRVFVQQTFDVINTGDACALAATFTFGREDLLPELFQRVVDELNVTTGGDLDDFMFYLSRHIELDGEQHGPMATQMIATLCGDDDGKWQVAQEAAWKSLEARKRFWDGMHQAMRDADEAELAVT